MEASGKTTSAPKRKRDGVALRIVDDLKRRDSRELSPETQVLMDKLADKAKRAVDDEDINQDDLEDTWKMLKKLIDAKHKVAETDEKLQALQQRLQAISSELNHHKYLLDVVDWTAHIQSWFKQFEPTIGHKFREAYKVKLEADGMIGHRARLEADKYKRWFAVKGYRVSQTYDFLKTELSQVDQWRSDGKPQGKEPATPYFDRVAQLCTEAGTIVTTYLDFAKVYVERNDLAHHPPPLLEDHLKPNVLPIEVDWDALWQSCKRRKDQVREDLSNGRISQEDHDFFLKAINLLFDTYVSTWDENGDAVTTPFGDSSVQETQTESRKATNKIAIPSPPSEYYPGKWDDIPSNYCQ